LGVGANPTKRFLAYAGKGGKKMIESVIRKELMEKLQKAQICFILEDKDRNLMIYPLNRIITSKLIDKINLILDDYDGFYDYLIGYDEEHKSVFVFLGGV